MRKPASRRARSVMRAVSSARERRELVLEPLLRARERTRERARRARRERVHARAASASPARRAPARPRAAARGAESSGSALAARTPRPHLVEPAHEALAARAVEQHVQPGEREVGARARRRRGAPRRSAAGGRARLAEPRVQPLREDRRELAPRPARRAAPRARSAAAAARGRARSSRNSGGSSAEAAGGSARAGSAGPAPPRDRSLANAPGVEARAEPQHELRQVAGARGAAHLGVERAQEAVRARQRDRAQARASRAWTQAARLSALASVSSVSRLSSIQTPVLSSIASRSWVTASESSPASIRFERGVKSSPDAEQLVAQDLVDALRERLAGPRHRRGCPPRARVVKTR